MLNALTVDVEDYYHVAAFESVVRFADWERYESRVERNTLVRNHKWTTRLTIKLHTRHAQSVLVVKHVLGKLHRRIRERQNFSVSRSLPDWHR